MLDGKKTIESRFTKNKVIPFNKVNTNDAIILKRSGGPIVGVFLADMVLEFSNDQIDINKIKQLYQDRLLIDQDFWDHKVGSRYATLIGIKSMVVLNSIYSNEKNRQPWIIVREGKTE